VSDPWRSYRMPAAGERLREYREPLPNPQGAEVLVRITASGVCHSDLHIWEGFFDLGGGRKLDLAKTTPVPHTLGHEIAGEVIALGPDVQSARPGDRCIVYPWIGCGECGNCKAGLEHICTGSAPALGIRTRGGFSTHVLVPHERYLVDGGTIPQELACTFACSGLTAFTALKKAAAGPDAPLLIVGAGGVGLSAVRMASTFHGLAPIVADIDPAKRDAALKSGASLALDPADPQAIKQLHGATGGGVAAAVDFVGVPQTVSFAIQAVRRGGRIVVVGLMGGSL
jgi:D-arabinose 1-dehydrogenase-like Zn-dependent alcohol dehydrogenase